jgi:phage terminase large subunit-like protein
MPLTGEAKAAWNKQYKAKLKAEREQLEKELNSHNLEKERNKKLQQATNDGKRYASELLSFEKLRIWYEGIEGSEILGKSREFGLPDNWESIPDFKADPESWIGLRDNSRKNLFWLGRDVLHRDLVERVHQPVCDFFVKKNFDGVYSKDTTLKQMRDAINRQDSMKERILLDPRGAYKSTIDGIDCIQWIINMPDIRIFIVTGKDSNADLFLTEIKGYFWQPEMAEMTDFQKLFPEFIITGVDGRSLADLITPARKFTGEKFATLWVNSVTSTLASLHCDILKGDDVVSDRNSNHPEARAKLKTKYDNVDNLRDEWGFADNIGTRYADDDWYGTRIKAIAEGAECAVFCRACWTVKPQFRDVPIKQLKLEMVDLLFPEKLGTAEQTFKELKKKLIKNEIEFRCQQLNEPVGDSEHHVLFSFNEDEIRSKLLQASAVPKDGDIYVAWDTALTDGARSDYSCAAAVKICKDKDSGVHTMYVIDILCERYKQSELAYHIVAFNKKWNPRTTIVEKLVGYELLQREVQRQGIIQGVSFDGFWKTPPNTPDAKINRIKGLETYLKSDQLYFVMNMYTDFLITQFCNFTGEKKNRGRKDDIPDAIAIAGAFMPADESKQDDKVTLATKKLLEEAKKHEDMKRQYDRIFGGAAVLTQPEPEPQPTGDPRRAAMQAIFRGNGLRA